MLNIADFDEAYATKPMNAEPIPCEAPECFVGSYPPVAKARSGWSIFRKHVSHASYT